MSQPVNMADFIAAKSDQMNADDLMDAPRTITITKVTAAPDAAEQPVSIHYEGDQGKPFKPCKTMRRILVGVWGKDASKYVGRSMTLYRDGTVAFGGLQVGGIRISHMSDISEDKTVALLVTRGRKAPFKIKPLVMQRAPAATSEDGAARWANGYIAKLADFTTLDALQTFATEKAAKLAELATARPELHEKVTAALATRTADLKVGSSFDDDDLGGGGQSMAEQIADRPGETDTFGLPPVDANSSAENITENITGAEKSVAEQAVEKVIAMAAAATTAEALEKIIAEAEGHKAAMGPELATKLEIALDQERSRFAPVGELAK